MTDRKREKLKARTKSGRNVRKIYGERNASDKLQTVGR